MKSRLLKRKGFNEIYFVLYLVAVILLIPDKNELNNVFDYSSVNNSTVYLSPEKINLNCILSKENNSINLKHIDSLNFINLIGDVLDINYSIQIRKNNLTQSISLTNDRHDSKQIYIEKVNNNLKFIWKPNTENTINQNYEVIVNAVANIINDNNEEEIIYLKTNFALNLFINDNIQQIASNDSIIKELLKNQNLNQNNYTGEFNINRANLAIDINPEKQSLKGISNETWTNTIRVIGINLKTELLSAPKINVFSENNSQSKPIIKELNENSLVLEGIFPAKGKSTIELNLIRNIDNKEIKTSFIVNTIEVDEPIYSSKIYPSQATEINPNLPFIGKNISSVIKLGNEILFRSNDGSKFDFTARDKDTNQTLTFERYINNKLVGKTYQILVLNLPAPKIIKKNLKDELTYTIYVRTFGFVDGERNTSKLYTDNSKIKPQEQYALYKEDKNSTIQVFSVKLNNKNEKITIFAKDKRKYQSDLIYIGK